MLATVTSGFCRPGLHAPCPALLHTAARMPWISDMSLPAIKLCLLPLPSEPSSDPFTLSKALRDQPGPSAPRALLAGAHLWTFARANLSALFFTLVSWLLSRKCPDPRRPGEEPVFVPRAACFLSADHWPPRPCRSAHSWHWFSISRGIKNSKSS